MKIGSLRRRNRSRLPRKLWQNRPEQRLSRRRRLLGIERLEDRCLLAVDAPTASYETDGLPNSLERVPVDGDFFVEVRVRDTGAPGVGIAAGYILLQTYLSPLPKENAQFGYSVAAMGDNVLIGARYDQTGAAGIGVVYLFDGATGNLLQSYPNPAQSATGEPTGFGRFVAAVGDNVLVGARWVDAATDAAGVM